MNMRTIKISNPVFALLALWMSCQFATTSALAAYKCDVFAAPGGYTSPDAVTSADGSVWYIAQDRLIRVRDRKAAGVVAVDAATVRLSGVTIGPDGAVWFSKDTGARVGRIPLDGTPGVEFTIPDGKFIRGIRAGTHDLWFYDAVVGFVGRISTSGAVRRYDGPDMGGHPFKPTGLAVAPDDSVWVSVIGQNAIYRLDEKSGQMTRFDIPTPNAQPDNLLVDRDGSVWFTMPAVRKLGHLLANRQIVETDLGNDAPHDLALGTDGALWYTYPTGSSMGRVSADGSVLSFHCGTNSGAMTIGPDGKLWAMGNNEISVVNDTSQPIQAPSQAAATALPAATKVSEVAISGLSGLLSALPGRTAVQFSSYDPHCGFCIPANRVFDQESLARPAVHFLRVHFEPWTSVPSIPDAKGYNIDALPIVIVYDNGKEFARVVGNVSAAQLDSKLQGNTP